MIGYLQWACIWMAETKVSIFNQRWSFVKVFNDYEFKLYYLYKSDIIN